MTGTCVFDEGSVGLLFGRRRVPAGGRRGRGGRLRPHAARAQLTIGTHPHARSTHTYARRRPGADRHFIFFHIFRLFCSTIYDLHTFGLLWCFCGTCFCHWSTMAIGYGRSSCPWQNHGPFSVCIVLYYICNAVYSFPIDAAIIRSPFVFTCLRIKLDLDIISDIMSAMNHLPTTSGDDASFSRYFISRQRKTQMTPLRLPISV